MMDMGGNQGECPTLWQKWGEDAQEPGIAKRLVGFLAQAKRGAIWGCCPET